MAVAGGYDPTGTSSNALPGSVQNPSASANFGYLSREKDDGQVVPASDASNKTLRQLKQDFLTVAATSPQQMMAAQQQLIDAGFLDPRSRSYHPGQVIAGDATYKAYEAMLRESLAAKKPWDALLEEKAAKKEGDKFLHESRSKQVSNVDLSDPTSARAVLVSAMSDRLGRRPTPSEIASFTAALQSEERANPVTTTQQVEVDNAAVSQGGAPVETVQTQTQQGGVGSAAGFADEWIDQHYANEAGSNTLTDIASVFQQMLGPVAVNDSLDG